MYDPDFHFGCRFTFRLGQFNVGDTTLAVTQLVGAVIFALASITDWLDGKIARARGLVTNFGKFADRWQIKC